MAFTPLLDGVRDADGARGQLHLLDRRRHHHPPRRCQGAFPTVLKLTCWVSGTNLLSFDEN